MVVDFLSRLILVLKTIGSGIITMTNDTSFGLMPNNLSVAHHISELDIFLGNDTVIIDNPFWESGDDDNPSYDTISLPLCCNFEPGGNNPFCSSPDETNWQSNNENISQSRYWYPMPHLFPSENRSKYKFTLSKPTCSTPLKTVKLSTDEFEVTKQGRFLADGYFGYDNEEFYSPQEYCINGLTGEFVQVMMCESPRCSSQEGIGGRPCIHKCCNPDEIYSFSRRACIKSKGVLFRPIFYHDLSTKLSELEGKDVMPHYHISFPRSFKHRCEENVTQIFPFGSDFAQYLSNFTNRKYYSAPFKMRKDGRLMYRKDGKAILRPEGYPIYLDETNKKCHTVKASVPYCIDGAAEYGSPDPFSNSEGEVFLVTCKDDLFEPVVIGPLSFVYGNVMITSSLFALLTVLVYMVVKEKQNIHGWTIASYAFSMFLMYIFLGLAHLIRYYGSNDVLKTASCVTVGIASHLFSMSSFMWLTVMNWDIWWTFRKFRPAARKGKGKEVKHFLTYSIVGWGLPLFITGISTFFHFKYEEASQDDCAVVKMPLPAYGRESCEIKQLSLGVYLYYPAAFLLGCNLLFFIVTTYRLCRHTRQTQLATRNLERHHQSVQLFAKLFFVMGVTRVFEVITWAESGPTLTWYWAVFDIFNVLQAVAIFIIYVCKRDVLTALKKLFLQFYYGHVKKSHGNETLSHHRKTLVGASVTTLLRTTTGSTQVEKMDSTVTK